jgi:hypothetical protein
MISDDDFKQAFDDMARTPAGRLVYLHLQRTLCQLCPSDQPGALRRHEGRRTFAGELMAMMAKGIEQSGGSDPSERPAVFAVRQRANISSRRGTERRVAGYVDDTKPT